MSPCGVRVVCNPVNWQLTLRLSAEKARKAYRWFAIPRPIALGLLVLAGAQFKWQVYDSISEKHGDSARVDASGHVVPSHQRISLAVYDVLPLNAISRLWGWANELKLPVWFRPYGFKLYSYVFGCNLDEMADPDLTHYRNLAEFFYREIKPDARPIAGAPLVSPADGKVLHFGRVDSDRRQVEQVKGITYSLDALLGLGHAPARQETPKGGMPVQDEEKFARVNGIDYSVAALLGEGKAKTHRPRILRAGWWKSWFVSQPAQSEPERAPVVATRQQVGDVSMPEREDASLSHNVGVAADMGPMAALPPMQPTKALPKPAEGKSLFFAVVYLAPGDYHHFHSPVSWVVERRRHFRGELYSVSPWMAERLPNLFVLNERVSLLGRWRHGFFSMVPVGATNVGSIKINFDQDLKTNTPAGKEAHLAPGSYSEATYQAASRMLGGQPLAQGDEVGGFLLGSTVVLLFEAPDSFQFTVQPGQKVHVGETMGTL